MIYIKVNNTLYPAAIDGQLTDYSWDGRSSKRITMQGTYEKLKALLPDGATWSIVMTTQTAKQNKDGTPVLDENGQPLVEENTEEWDNSDFSLSGPITDNRDGTCTIKMGKPTDLEEAYELIIGGNAE